MAAPSLATFLIEFPELNNATFSAMAQAKLDTATAMCNSTVWGDLHSQGISYLAAHLIAISPAGRKARLADSAQKSAYWDTYLTLLQQVTAGYRTT